MLPAVLSVVVAFVALGVVILWIYNLAKWDGKKQACNTDECDRCPFPCEKHNERRRKL